MKSVDMPANDHPRPEDRSGRSSLLPRRSSGSARSGSIVVHPARREKIRSARFRRAASRQLAVPARFVWIRMRGCSNARHGPTAQRNNRAGDRRSGIREIVRDPNVAVDEVDAAGAQPVDGQFAASATKVVEGATVASGRSLFIMIARLEPTKPAPPVTRTRINPTVPIVVAMIARRSGKSAILPVQCDSHSCRTDEHSSGISNRDRGGSGILLVAVIVLARSNGRTSELSRSNFSVGAWVRAGLLGYGERFSR